jgi:SAM-dependent methyltransferase
MAIEGISGPAPAAERDSAERFDPEIMGGGLMEAEHWARYRWAAPWVPGKEVLDAGCGVGYGTRLLAEREPARLVGVDLSAEALERAPTEDAEFVQADLHQIPFDADTFDVVVCFEVIEHVHGHVQVLDELRRVLRPGGALLISSPNRDVYAPGNPHHVHEFLPDELHEELSGRFDHVKLYGQHVFLASTIVGSTDLRAGEPRSCPVAIMKPLERGRETYILGVASDEPPPDHGRLIALGDGFELRWWHQELDDAQSRLAESKRQAKEAETGLQRRLLELEQEVAGVRELQHELDMATRETVMCSQIIEDLTSSMSWRLTAPLRAAKRMLR